MSESPLVSVVIPTYNHAHFLRAALDSVRDQTFENWEAVVVNNFSEDDTETVVESRRDPRIKLVNYANHGIIAASRNRGIAMAGGRFVAFLDSDDLWYPRKLERCLAVLETGYDLVCHGERWVGRGKPRDVFYGPEPRARFDSLLYDGNCLSTSAVVVRRDVVAACGGFSEDPALVTAEDYHLWLTLARRGARIGFVEEILGEYRIHQANQSGAVLRNMRAEMAVVDKFISETGNGGLSERCRARRRRALVHYAAGRGFHAGGRDSEALAQFAKAFSTFPLLPKLYAAAAMSALGRLVRFGGAKGL